MNFSTQGSAAAPRRIPPRSPGGGRCAPRSRGGETEVRAARRSRFALRRGRGGLWRRSGRRRRLRDKGRCRQRERTRQMTDKHYHMAPPPRGEERGAHRRRRPRKAQRPCAQRYISHGCGTTPPVPSQRLLLLRRWPPRLDGDCRDELVCRSSASSSGAGSARHPAAACAAASSEDAHDQHGLPPPAAQPQMGGAPGARSAARHRVCTRRQWLRSSGLDRRRPVRTSVSTIAPPIAPSTPPGRSTPARSPPLPPLGPPGRARPFVNRS